MARLTHALVPVLVLTAGVGAAAMLIATRPGAAQLPPEQSAVPVEVVSVQRGPYRVHVEALGVVKPIRQVVLFPEVAGRIVEQSPHLVPGGQLLSGDLLVRIDARDYSAAVSARMAALEQARVALEEERTQRRIAEYEWKGAAAQLEEETRRFALREPHLQSARAGVESASGQLHKAKRDVSRTRIYAPFDAVVLDESVDIGQAVGPQTPVATLAGIDRFWIQVSLPVAKLAFVEVPEMNTDRPKGSAVRVVHEPGDGVKVERIGWIDRVLGSVDERGKMAQVMVAVEDPLDTRLPVADRPIPLLLGAYVAVDIDGRVLEDVVALPARAIHEEDRVWVVDADQRLEPRTVEVRWRERERVFIGKGLSEGDRVVVSPLPVATPKMPVSVEERPSAGTTPAEVAVAK